MNFNYVLSNKAPDLERISKLNFLSLQRTCLKKTTKKKTLHPKNGITAAPKWMINMKIKNRQHTSNNIPILKLIQKYFTGKHLT